MSTNREHWGSKLGVLFATAGSAIGLGTMWMLPYVMGQNGGGLFIFLFLLFTLLFGIPLFIAELTLGRKTQTSPVNAFLSLNPNGSWKIIGWLSIVCVFLVIGWYCVVAGWGLHYILMSLVDALHGKSPQEITNAFHNFQSSGDLNIFWQLVFLTMTCAIVYQGVSKGIEYWSKFMTSALLILLVCLVAYSMTLPGFSHAVGYIFTPDFSKLNTSTILKALGLSLFALSLSQGIMITYGSYMQKDEDIPKTAFLVGCSIVLVAVLVSLMIYPMIFSFNFEPAAGAGLIYQTLPFIFDQLPGSTLIGVVFFTLLIFTALTSSISMLEVPVASFMDLYNWSRKKSILVSAVITFLLGLPTALMGTGSIFANWQNIYNSNFLETNYIITDWLFAIIALLTVIFLGWKVPKKIMADEFLSGTNSKWLLPWWQFLIKWILPLGILLIILQRAHVIR